MGGDYVPENTVKISDKLISIISPKWAAQRLAYRQAFDEMRNYDVGDDSRLNAKWRVANSSGEFADRSSRDIVRARARDLERNSDMMNGVISAWVRNIIGRGRILQVQTEDIELNNQISELWKRWCKARNCDVTGSQTFNQILRTAVRRKKVDGGVLFVKRYTDYGMVPFQLQMLEVDELDVNQYEPKYKGNKVIGGVEYTKYNRPVGYYFRTYSLDGIELLKNPVFVEAKDVIFYFSKTRFSQVREMSEQAPIMKRIRDANEFITAVSIKERIMACLSVFIKRTLPQVGGLGRSSNGNANGSKKQSYAEKTLEPGMMMELNSGDEIQVVNPTGQAMDASSHVRMHQRLIGAGSGLSYEATSRDVSQTNYSSSRLAIIEDGETFSEDNESIEAIMDEVYETFVISCVLAGLLSIKDFWENKEKYFTHKWIKAPKPWIDPAKEANANKTAVETGEKTFIDLCAENGKDWRQSIDDIAAANKYAAEKGVDMSNLRGGGNSVQSSKQSNEE
jgi:lambda family phage portal protein